MARTLLRLCFFALTTGLLIGPALAGAGSGDRHGRLEGQLVELHRDRLDAPPEPGYGIDRGDGTRLLQSEQPRELVGQDVAVDDDSNEPGVQGEAEATDGVQQLAASGGTQKTAVVLVNFANDTSTPVTAEQLKSRVFTGSGSVSDFYEQQSGGTVDLGGIDDPSGDVFGWWTLPMSVPTGCTDNNMMSVRSQAISYANSQNVNLGAYDHVVIYFPQNAGCGWAGLGELPGNWSWINGLNNTSVIAHEIGHNMGVHHAASLKCGSSTLTASTAGCSYVEYGDNFDVMGSSSALMSGWQRAKLGQQPSAARVNVTASGTYTIDQLNNGSAVNPRLLIVPRQIGSAPVTEYFAIDLRAPFGNFDTFSPASPLVTGVGVRLVPALSVIDVTQLLDAHPSTSTFNDSPLQPGETFTDPGSGVSITNTATSGGSATITIALGSGGADSTAPSAPVLSTGTSPSGVVLSWTAATDNVGVDHYEIRRDGMAIASVPSGLLSYTDAAATALLSASYRVVAFDAVGNSTQSAAAVVTIPDYVAPELAVATAVRRANGDVQLDLSATDARGVTGYSVGWPGGAATSATGSWLHQGAPPEAFSYTVRAYDAAGNLSPALTVEVPAAPAAFTPPPGDGDGAGNETIVLPPNPDRGGKRSARPRFVVSRGARGRFTVTVSGARRVSLSGGGLSATSTGSRLRARLTRAMRNGRGGTLKVTAIVAGKTYRTTLTVRRGVVRLG